MFFNRKHRDTLIKVSTYRYYRNLREGLGLFGKAYRVRKAMDHAALDGKGKVIFAKHALDPRLEGHIESAGYTIRHHDGMIDIIWRDW